MNSMKIKSIILIWAGCLLMASCGGDKEYYEIPTGPDGKPLENPGQITVPPASLPSGSDNPVIIDKNGNYHEITPGKSLDLEEGTYQFVIITPQTGLNVNGVIVSLPVLDGSMEVPVATNLYADIQTVNIIRNKETEVIPNLKPLSRELQIKLNIAGITEENITEVKATLYGVAHQIDASKGFGAVISNPTRSDGEYYYTSATMAPYTDGGSINMRLLGIQQGAKPYITFTISRKGANPYVIRIDATNEMNGFNYGNPETPLIITAMFKLGVGGMTGSISPWTPGPIIEIEGK